MKPRAVLALAVLVITTGIARAAAPASPRGPIEVQVEVNEVDNTKAARLGVDWLDAISLAESVPAGVVSLGPIERLTPLKADIHFLMEEGAAELLANPNLVTDSGSPATFRAGGEIPYITNSSLGASNVQFKPYGVMLNVQPTLLADGKIQMKLQAGVSAPDSSAGTMVSGNAVPALLTREVTSHVTVPSGVTITLAGLVQTEKIKTSGGVPLLRKVPLLGALFRWRRTNFRRTTIIIFATPRVVPPREP